MYHILELQRQGADHCVVYRRSTPSELDALWSAITINTGNEPTEIAWIVSGDNVDYTIPDDVLEHIKEVNITVKGATEC